MGNSNNPIFTGSKGHRPFLSPAGQQAVQKTKFLEPPLCAIVISDIDTILLVISNQSRDRVIIN